ncbi:putative disease resistance protein RGA3 isoform X2 [Phragmites australis]|uniref:putative disease resistance protein RGA3 isoform X2 n=1 Tax=Phragmites australis TaxID=29695 RepID=UPI002D79E0B2|nr:putative disease resistance protein RGA3 isoform X2 [Phragmites australis]
MAALFAAMAVERALDNLSSLLPATPTSTPLAAAAASGGLEDLRMLEPTMGRIHAALHDAEQHWNLREESAKLRLKELKDLAYDAEDVVEGYEYHVSRCRVEDLDRSRSAAVLLLQAAGSGSNKRKRQQVQDEHYSIEAGIVPVPNELALRARKVIERFTEIKDYSDSFSLSENDGERKFVPDIRSVRQTGSIVYAPRILGREKDKEEVIEKLMSRSREENRFGRHMSVLAIVGMGGLGKTTLAQLVYNDTRVCQSFDLRAWVCVSEYFDVENITRKIVTSLTRNSCDHIQDCELQGAFVDLVKEKRLFLVLDDVWNERRDYWELLCMPMLASRQCDIIVTTRSKAVARLVQTMPFYNLNCLSPDESWSLFKQTAFVEQEVVTPANLVEIGRSITEKCKGLPLAIKTLGSIFRYETNETKWRDVLESELWDLKQSRNEVLPALELSYKYMPVHLKRCFVSLSLYPKDIYLDENRVILLWKLLDLLHYDGNNNVDEIGSLYFNELVQRSLLQNYIDGQRVMHDLIHDLACFLAGEEFFRLEGDKPIYEIPRDARYMCMVPDREKSIQISNASQSLRAIIMTGNIVFKNPEALFLKCRKYRIIHIEQICYTGLGA